ncbi:MAG TPA: FecR domain-containing protein, partial [Bacteroidales bacterium]|nr:FecR domain-containing protein [Bacteroidales bacterium]
MSKSKIIESLLSGYVEGRLSPEEKNQFFDLLADSANESVFREILMKNIYASPGTNARSGMDPDFSNIYSRIIQQIDRMDSEEAEIRSIRRKAIYRRVLINITAAAAVFAFAFIIGRFSVRFEADNAEPSISTYEIKSPYGSRSEISLPDGTTVILNAGSFLSYSNDYNHSNRNVTLKGEAYFNVARNENMPFVVNAGPLNITALGTEFNVKAYDEENAIETTLVTGKVAITREGSGNDSQAVDLNPNQKAIFIRNQEGFLLEDIKDSEEDSAEPEQTIMSNILIAPKVNVEQVVAWTTGKLIFRGESLDRLCVELERKYDVTIIF